MKTTITIRFEGFWKTFDPRDNKFVRALATSFDVVVLGDDTDVRPDILIYSWYDNRHLLYDDSVKIYYTGENDVPDFNECDYALSFHHIDMGGRHMRYPLYMMYEYDMAATRRPDDVPGDAAARGFCTCLMRNWHNCDPHRLEIVDAVEAYRPVTYGGVWRNNIGHAVVDKIEFIAGYKFNLALENCVLPGYVTEKLVEPLAARTVPVYWGAPDVDDDFNPEAFVNVADYDTLDSFVSDLKAIDTDTARYMSMLRAPALAADTAVDFDARLAEFMCSIASHLKVRRVHAGYMSLKHRDNALVASLMETALTRRVMKLMYRLRRKY